MEKLSVEEYKTILVDLLVSVDIICKENNIDYSLGYGTLLGAVRHKGFIPWDDDIDVMMTRENFNKFVSVTKQNNDSWYVLTNDAKDYNLMFAKFVSKKTLIVSSYKDRYKNDLGLYIDIFPMDYITGPKEKAYKILKKNRFDSALLVAAQWGKFYINKNRSRLRQIIRFPFYLLSRLVKSKRLIKKINKKIPKEKTNLLTFYGDVTEFGVHDKSIFESYVDIEFEGYTFKAIKDYDSYLKEIYGDYMQLPPEEKRIMPHNFDAFLL